MSVLTIKRYSQGICVSTDHHWLAAKLSQFCSELTQRKTVIEHGRFKFVDGDKYYIHDRKNNEYWFSVRVEQMLLDYISNANAFTGWTYTINTVEYKPKKPHPVDYSGHSLTMIETDPAWTFQNDVVDYAVSKERNHCILEVQTGKGKSKMSMKVLVRLACRGMYITKASYLDKWAKELREMFSFSNTELIKVGSKNDFINLIKKGQNKELDGSYRKPGDCVKIILVSSHIVEDYITDYFNNHPKGWVHPAKVLEVLGVGQLGVDETHEYFKKNYIISMVLNPIRLLDMSATLVPDDDFLKLRYVERMPLEFRYDKLEYDIYAKAACVFYRIADRTVFRKLNNMRMYNHTELEKWILKRKRTTKEYFEFCDKVLDLGFHRDREPQMRALVIFATVEMCVKFTDYMTEKHPDLTVRKYNQGDNYEEAIEADIVVSTPGKSSTAIDIKGLVQVLNTVASKASQRQIQILGRARKLFTWERAPLVSYIACGQIIKHREYHEHRLAIIKPLVTEFVEYRSNRIIGE